MIKKYFYLLPILLFTTSGWSQKHENHRLQLGADIGFSKIVIEESLLNYYRYKGWNFLPVHLRASFEDKDGFHFLTYFHQTSLLKPLEEYLFYKENKLRLLVYELSYNYLFRIKQYNNGFAFYAGAGYLGHFTFITQTYENTLYFYANGTRYSFELTAGSFTGNFMIDYQKNKYLLRFKSGYSLINFTQRPTDYFTFQGNSNDIEYKLMSVNEYLDLDMSLQYHYSLSNRFSIYGECFYRYLSYYNYPKSKSYKFFTNVGLTYKLF